MPDITKCRGTDCPLKEHCYRYTSKADEHWQSYFVEPPYKNGKCEMFWGENQEQILINLQDIVNGKNLT